MTSLWDRELSSDVKVATPFDIHRESEGQCHDRIHGDDLVTGVSSTIAMSGDNDDVDVEITAGQKMLSAMSGSLLTSLLGKFTVDCCMSITRSDCLII